MSIPDMDLQAKLGYLATATNLTARIIECEYNRTLLVRAAVRNGATWKQVGEALGCSAQAAWKKYRPDEPPKIKPGQG